MYVCMYILCENVYGSVFHPHSVWCLSLPVSGRRVATYDPCAAVVTAGFADCYVGGGVPHALGWEHVSMLCVFAVNVPLGWFNICYCVEVQSAGKAGS